MKTDVILIHGFRGNHLGLEAVAKALPKKLFNVYVPDIPPAGGEDLAEYSARFYAHVIADYIKEHKLKKPVLVGHSMGSIVAASVADRYPELINDKIVFLSPISIKPSRLVTALAPLTSIVPDKFIGYISTKYLYVPQENDKLLLREILDTTYACGADYVSKRAVYKSAKFSSSCCIADFDFDKNALFLAGEKDRLIPAVRTKELAESIGGKAVFIKGTGHLCNYENPKAVAREIKKFLAKK